MTFLKRLLGSARVYTTLVLFAALVFPVILVYISTHDREQSWPFIRKCFAWMLAVAGVKFRVEGLEHRDFSEGYMLMGNHTNWLDHFILATVFPRPFVGFEKTENFKVPMYGPMMKKWGNLALNRKGDPEEARRAAAQASELLRQGVNFLVYPEGTRTKTGEVGEFKKGGFHTAIDAGARILPFTYNGQRAIMTRGRWWAMPGTITMTFGEPIDAKLYGKERLNELVADTRAAIVSKQRDLGGGSADA